jgi:hypothetical protein
MPRATLDIATPADANIGASDGGQWPDVSAGAGR